MATVDNIVSSAGVTTAAVVDTAALVASGEPAKVAVEVAGGGTISASISSEALAQVGGNAVVLVTAINESLLASFQQPAEEGQAEEEVTTLVSQPVSIRLVNEDGEEVSIADLTEPIEVSLSVPNKTDDMVCGWFDEDTGLWRTDNIELLDGSGDNFICGTTHLTIFGAIIEGVLGAIACSNADLLTPKGLSRLADDVWWYQPGAILFWVLVAGELTLMFYIGHRSAVQRALRGWSDEHLLTASAAFDKSVGKEAESLLKKNKTRGSLGSVGEVGAKKKPIYTPGGLADFLTLRIARMAVAAQQGLNQQDLGAILKGGMTKRVLDTLQKSKGDVWEPEAEQPAGFLQRLGTRRLSNDTGGHHGSLLSRSTTKKMNMTKQQTRAALQTMLDLKQLPVVKDVGAETKMTLSNFMEMSFFRRTMVLFNAANAWVSLGQFSFTVPPTFRTLLLSMRVHGSLFCSAFFFSASGAPGKDADPRCSPVGFWQNVGRNIVISMFAVIVGSVPFAIMSAAAYRSFVYKEHWDEVTKQKYLKKMRMQGRALWCIGVFYVSFCTLFVATFLANVGEGATVDWLTTATTDLILSIIVEPLIKALAFAVLLSFATTLRPKQVREQIDDLQTTFAQLIDESKEEDTDHEDKDADPQGRAPSPELRAPAQYGGPLPLPPPPTSGYSNMRLPGMAADGMGEGDEVPNFVRAEVVLPPPIAALPALPPLPPLDVLGNISTTRKMQRPPVLAPPPPASEFWALRSPMGTSGQAAVAPMDLDHDDDDEDETPGPRAPQEEPYILTVVRPLSAGAGDIPAAVVDASPRSDRTASVEEMGRSESDNLE